MILTFIIFLALPLVVLFLFLSFAMVIVVDFVFATILSLAVAMVLVPAFDDVVEVGEKPIATTIASQDIGGVVTEDRDTLLKEMGAIEPRAGAGTADVGHPGAERSSRIPLRKDGQERIPISV